MRRDYFILRASAVQPIWNSFVALTMRPDDKVISTAHRPTHTRIHTLHASRFRVMLAWYRLGRQT